MSYDYHHNRVPKFPTKENNSMEMGQSSQSGSHNHPIVDDTEKENCADMKFVDSSLAKDISSRDVLVT